uniref:Orotidine 5'-phosphate decarboxylase n=1 Tax=Kluyveromyces marxianus TaxID=4911 RepID=Q873Y6_KLUMA|nr:orotidine 5'-phosphate decarboxylase [Kluyveromyces marxianus]
MSTKSYSERAAAHRSPVAAKLLNLMEEKKSNLCASLDVRKTAELLRLVEVLGPYICLLKTHVDILEDFSFENTIVPLKQLAEKHKFLIFEDRKFADIGNTVKLQYTSGVYRIAEWSDITNAHGVTGAGIVAGLKQGAEEVTKEPRGLLMLAVTKVMLWDNNTELWMKLLPELSSKGSLAHGEYTRGTVEIAKSDKDFVIGFIAQNDMGGREEGYDWLIMTPGVGLDGSDIIIVGRGLFAKGRDPVVEGERYRKAGWDAYLKRVGRSA